ncbi:MAG: pilus assembly protein CpaE [Lacisediminihabitans sp.]
MISTIHARTLRDIGLEWHPVSGDAFRLDREEFDSEVFTVSDMTVEAHVFDSGTILGFNGTTEWALDSVAIEDSLWLPREDQLRQLLGGGFRALVKLDGEAGYRVDIVLQLARLSFTAAEPADAYAAAVETLLRSALE